ncbi:tectonic-1 [Battus philenor]|uniref:tectonic-1 n=1 Tax=Battus philenor TaxID=42288 RepID=UPI0035CFDD27
MKLLTYFVFTLLSIVIQFCLMDFIQEKLDVDEKLKLLNRTIRSQKTPLQNLKDNTDNAYALYYRLNKDQVFEEAKDLSETKYINTSLQNMLIAPTTDMPFSVFDVLYDDNISIADGETTTETFTTEPELDNVTEISWFERKSSTTVRPTAIPKKGRNNDLCYCNLLYNQCDINCCCDDECSPVDKDLFGEKCMNFVQHQYNNHWVQPLKCDQREVTEINGGFTNLFCIAKTNLPDQNQVLKQKNFDGLIKNAYLWHDNYKSVNLVTYKGETERVLLLKNQSIYYIDLPVSVANGYCSTRRPMIFLRNEKLRCHVRMKDLEMFHILKTINESTVISVGKNMNNAVVNCSSFHCTNWTIDYCYRHSCFTYNESSLHQPTCTGAWCNVARKLVYIFHVHNATIIKATVKFYIQNISIIPNLYATQEIDVKFYISNTPSERIIKLSGNPGYITGLPVIVSFLKSNHSDQFYNSTNDNGYLSYAENQAGFCVLSTFTKKDIQFGINKRTKCKIILAITSTSNATDACFGIQRQIKEKLCVDRKAYVSPYGNPINLNDADWLPIELQNKFVYGEFKSSKLLCHNLETRVAFIFTYADLSNNINVKENKLLSAKVEGFQSNVTLETEKPTAVITIDINFINLNKLKQQEVARPPYLHLSLPKNFFFPFPSNECRTQKQNVVLISHLCIIALFIK